MFRTGMAQIFQRTINHSCATPTTGHALPSSCFVTLKNETRKVDIRLQIDNNGKDREPRLTKHVLVDGLKMNVSSLSGVVNVVMFLPQNMVLVEGSPRDRRNYLDTTISQVDSVYANAVRDYKTISN